MDKNNSNSKLDETVKKTLINFEAPYNNVDWIQMESMLDVAPKQNPLSRSYSPAILFAVAVLGVAFLLYTVLKPSEISEKTNKTSTPQLVKTPPKSLKVKPVVTQSLVINPVASSIKKESKPSLIPVTTHSNNIVPSVSLIKNNAKSTEKKVITKETAANSDVSTNKNNKQPTLSDNEIKSKLFSKTLEKSEKDLKKEKTLKKEALLKKEKVLKKEIKKDAKREENDSVHIDEENDSNKNRQFLKTEKEPILPIKTDTLKGLKEKNKGEKETKKETRKSKREKKKNANDSLDGKNSPENIIKTEIIKKNQDQNKKDTLKALN